MTTPLTDKAFRMAAARIIGNQLIPENADITYDENHPQLTFVALDESVWAELDAKLDGVISQGVTVEEARAVQDELDGGCSDPYHTTDCFLGDRVCPAIKEGA